MAPLKYGYELADVHSDGRPSMPSGHGPIEVCESCGCALVDASPSMPSGHGPIEVSVTNGSNTFSKSPPSPPGMAPLKWGLPMFQAY